MTVQSTKWNRNNCLKGRCLSDTMKHRIIVNFGSGNRLSPSHYVNRRRFIAWFCHWQHNRCDDTIDTHLIFQTNYFGSLVTVLIRIAICPMGEARGDLWLYLILKKYMFYDQRAVSVYAGFSDSRCSVTNVTVHATEFKRDGWIWFEWV